MVFVTIWGNITLLESVQKRAMKMMKGFKSIDLFRLEKRRLTGGLIVAYGFLTKGNR